LVSAFYGSALLKKNHFLWTKSYLVSQGARWSWRPPDPQLGLGREVLPGVVIEDVAARADPRKQPLDGASGAHLRPLLGRKWLKNYVKKIGERFSGLPDLSWYNIPKREKYTKIYQMAIKFTHTFYAPLSENYPIRDFWFENVPSGNPVLF
jgi:hypothetical protein